MKLFFVFTRNICLENGVEKIDYLLVKHIYVIRLFHNLIQVWKSACCGKYTIVIKSFWLVLSLEIKNNKTNQKISNYEGVSLVKSNVSTCAGHTADDMNWEVAQKPQDHTLYHCSVLWLVEWGGAVTWKPFLVPGSVLMNTPLGVIEVYFSPITYLLCVLKFLKIS